MKAIYKTPFGQFVRVKFRTINNFKKSIHVSEPTARNYIIHPYNMRIKDITLISEITNTSRDEIWGLMAQTERVNNEYDQA